MKYKIISFFFFIILSVSYGLSQGVEFVFQSSSFYVPGQGPYIETYTSFFGRSLIFKRTQNSKMQAKAHITVIVWKDTVVYTFRKYILNSPVIDDTARVFPNFIDVQRIAVENGTYTLQYIVGDMNDTLKAVSEARQITQCNFSDTAISFSGIELIERYRNVESDNILTKSGIELIPYISSFYPASLSKITFYCELYGMNKYTTEGNDFIFNYFIESDMTRQREQKISRFQKQKAASVNVLLASLDITLLPSGNYNLVVEARDRQNNLVQQTKAFFQRSNPACEIQVTDLTAKSTIPSGFMDMIYDRDSLIDYINALYPISSVTERQYAANIIAAKDLSLMQNFFYNFWLNRSTDNPLGEWKIYKREVDKVNNLYGMPFKKGYVSDRGRVYLQYGPPSSVYTSAHEPSALPYEIWKYNAVAGQTDVKFIFYNPRLAGKDYDLLHSNAKGELSNNNWMAILNTRFKDFINTKGGVTDTYTIQGSHYESEFYGIDIDPDNQIRAKNKR